MGVPNQSLHMKDKTTHDAQGREIFNQTIADRFTPPSGMFGEPMRRTFVEWQEAPGGVTVDVLPQVWRCSTTGAEVMDEWQRHCLNRAVELAAKSEGEVLYYHTRAWRANPET